MTDKSVTLASHYDGRGSSRTWVTVHADGSLTVEGQDLGDMVEAFWGPGNREYEWARTIPADDVARLAAALEAGGDVVLALVKRYSEDPFFQLQRLLDEHGIRYACWSRVGD